MAPRFPTSSNLFAASHSYKHTSIHESELYPTGLIKFPLFTHFPQYLHALYVSNDTDRHYEWAVAMADSNSRAQASSLLLAELTPSIIDCIRDFIRSDTAGAEP